MFDYQKISEYQIEITSYCNAACPQCPRNINGHGINPVMPLQHLSRAVIDCAFPAELLARVRQIFFCGSYGDPIMHPEFLDILRDFRSKHPTVWLYVHTNGGVHDPEYWQEIAKIFNGYGQIDFGIDGLKDTLGVYRRNVDYNRVINNAQAYISAGGRAQWNFIIFRHNEHQVKTAEQLAKDMGFFNFLPRKTGRFFNHRTLEEQDHWPIESRKGCGKLEPPVNPEYRNRSMMFLPKLKKEFANIRDYFNTTPIRCDALENNKVAINVEGLVLPCNFFNHNLYDLRFRDPEILPGSHELSNVDDENQVRKFLESYGLDNLNIHNNTLETIFANPMWADLVSSWNQDLDRGRLFECAMTCGSKLTKVWDQGGNNR